MAEIEVSQADITTLEVDAIANAANTQLRHGGGVAGAISRAGGPAVQEESDRKAPIGLGEAVETTAGEMPARWVIHAATMELGGPTSAEIIRRATASTLARADALGARSLALVAFGTGVGGFPLEEAARIEVEEVRRHLADGSSVERVAFAVRGEQAARAFEMALGGGVMLVANIFGPEFDKPTEREGFSYQRARVGRQAGGERLGASLYDLPPGQATFPYHWHSANEELLIVLSGRPSVRTPDGWRQLEEGEAVAFPVGERGAHQIANRTDQPVRFLVVSEMNAPEMSVYPDTNKVGVLNRPPGSRDDPDELVYFFQTEHSVDYWEGEKPPREE